MAHKHAGMMYEFALDAKGNDAPWSGWEYKLSTSDKWVGCRCSPCWDSSTEYRRFIRVISINGIEVPEPMRKAPAQNSAMYFVDLSRELGCRYTFWIGNDKDFHNLKAGILHTNLAAASAHAKALLSFSRTSHS